MNGALAGLAVAAAIAGCLVWLYNRLIRLRNLARSSWSDIDVLLKKRHDLVGNLVEAVKGYASYEKAVLLGVTEARARAMRAEGPGEKGKEEAALREQLASLFAVVEGYPALKANESFLELQKGLAEIENGIEYARRYYNAVARDYKSATETFPANLFAPRFGFGPEEFFQLDSPAERERTDVRLSVLAVLLFLPAAFLAVPAGAEDFTIRSFRAAIEVRDDASLRVAETIEVEFLRPRHGIFRDIPFRYTDELGKETLTPIRILSVTDASGAAWKHRTDRTGGILRVRVGDPDRFVGGRQVYVIAYMVENAVLFFPDHDELYWNVTGNGWPVPIGSATATATVAAERRSLALKTLCYTGARGSRESACEVSDLRNGASFASTRPFREGEGMTIVLGWEKGVVRPPSGWETALFGLNLADNWVFAAPLLAFGYMLTLWYRKGKDPATGDPLVVAYGPPDQNGRPLLPAEIGALIDETLDPKDITASVVDLAVKKYLTIEERKSPGRIFDRTDYVLGKVKEPGADLPAFERLLMERIFQGRGSEVNVSELKLSFYRCLDELKEAAFDGLKGMKCFTATPSKVKGRYFGAGFLILLAGASAGALGRNLLGPRAAVAGGLCGLAVLLFAPIMPVKTLKGVKVLGRIKGFEEFLLRAEKDRLERMNDKNLFEKYLPYAIALGVSERWAEAFEDIYQEPPGWYASEGGLGTFRPASFHHSLDSALSSMSGAMYSSPRSGGSGFSGGGSTGGGSGGGGGGSW